MLNLNSAYFHSMIRTSIKWQRDSERCLVLFKHNKLESLLRHVTLDEIWTHNFTPQSNQHLFKWNAHDEPQRANTPHSARKVLRSIYSGDFGIIFGCYFEKERDINRVYHEVLLEHLKDETEEAEITVSSIRQCFKTISKYHENDGARSARSGLQIVSTTSTIILGSRAQRLFLELRPQGICRWEELADTEAIVGCHNRWYLCCIVISNFWLNCFSISFSLVCFYLLKAIRAIRAREILCIGHRQNENK